MTAILYAGPFDGRRAIISGVPATIKLRGHVYRYSESWSFHFRQPAYVPMGFKGRPSKSLTK